MREKRVNSKGGKMTGSRRTSKTRRSMLSMASLLTIGLCVVGLPCVTPTPNIRDSIQTPIIIAEGDNAPLTCVVRQLGKATVVWKKLEAGKSGPKILTAGETRVTSDERFRIIHDNGGDVWVLAITGAQHMDSGLYICEVNTDPPTRSFHNLTVLSLSIQPPNSTLSLPHLGDDADVPFEDSHFSYKGQGSIAEHNYTSCCVAHNVSKGCLGFCTLKSILEGETGKAEQCEDQFPSIVKCMADGRNHVPCCVREGVPDICQDLCRGDYTTVTDKVKTHFSCPIHIERTLSCIADGVEILPSEPQDVETMALSSNTIKLSWSIPGKNGDTVTEYVVNVTTLRSFDAVHTDLGDISLSTVILPAEPLVTSPSSTFTNSHGAEEHDENGRPIPASEINAQDKGEAKMMQIKVDGDHNSTLIQNLQPFTMYEITVTAFNIHGGSLPSIRVRTLTLAPGLVRPSASTAPKLPDVKQCCSSKGVNTPTCVDKLCDPKMASEIKIPDLMICAPWSQDIFPCLTDGKDHTACCRQRGIPSPCDDLCHGNITKLDYKYFKCVRYWDDYTNCLMEGYGVLPSAPTTIRVSNVNEDFAIIHWTAPELLAETITGYNVFYRPLSTIEKEYHVIANVHSPYILEKLYSNAEYEVYVEAVNEHGKSQGSQRVVFRTASLHELEAELDPITRAYNETQCCVEAGMSAACLPLCSYDASMSDVRALAVTCSPELQTLLRCAAGGRDHQECCQRRGVSDACLPVCRGQVPENAVSMAENCLPFIGNIVQCYEEGVELIPGQATDFHVDFVKDTEVALSWDPPVGSNVTGFEVHYLVADPTFSRDLNLPSLNVTVAEPQAIVSNLTTGQVYKFYVVSKNEHGSSFPSATILVNVSSSAFNGTKISGVLSPPHSLTIASHGAAWVQILWQPPLNALPSEKMSFNVYRRSVKDTVNVKNETNVNGFTLENLKPNSQYVVYVTAMNSKGESLPSETLVVWTDPAHSPVVEPPRIQPAQMIVEGRSMMISCVALADPTPTITLYINGKVIKQQTDRHLSYQLENVTRDVDIVTCFADNGYGTPMESSRRVQILHKPTVQGADVTPAILGDTVVLECLVNAHPEPRVNFGRSKQDRASTRKYSVEKDSNEDEPGKYRYKLKITNVTEEDVGNYSCEARNIIGDDSKTFELSLRSLEDFSADISGCCKANNVSPQCMDACSYFMDIESLVKRPECIPDFDKLMKCASDGRDHRSCCQSRGVARRCLDWCRGVSVSPVVDSGSCALEYTRTILTCFHNNRDLLPGLPQGLRVQVISDNEVEVTWDPPLVNPQRAASYRVLYRAKGEKGYRKIETNMTTTRISDLHPGIQYELVIKAGNSYGTSVLTEPVPFVTEDNAISSARTGGSSKAGVASMIILLVLVAGVVVAGGVWFVRKRHFGTKPPGAIAFENPSYIRETNPDSIHSESSFPSNGSVPSVSNGVTSSTGNGWHTETLHPPRAETEVSPTLYEELRLGSEGAGFRRLKP